MNPPENAELALVSESQPHALSLYDAHAFEHAQRISKLFSESQLVPPAFQKNIANCTIAVEIASRMGASALMVMQNINIIHNRPSWSSQFIIAALNACGRFTPLRFVFDGQRGSDDWGCRAEAMYKKTTEKLVGVTVTIKMAKAEGWFGKSGSKWQTMPELMLQYRAATFFGRMFAPEILMGLPTQDEVIDVHAESLPGQASAVAGGEPAQPQPETKRSRRGLAAAKSVEKVDPPAAPAAETPAPAPAAAAPDTPAAAPEAPEAAPEAPPAPEPSPEAPEVTPEPAPQAPPPAPPAETTVVDMPVDGPKRCEVVSMAEVPASTPSGKVVKVSLKGEFTGFAYFNGSKDQIPGPGSVVDAVIEKKESTRTRGTFADIIKSIAAVG